MPQSKEPQVRYNKTLDQTYIIHPNGSTSTLTGDVRGMPGMLNEEELKATDANKSLKGNPGSELYGKNLGKDILADLASSAATAFLPGGPIIKGLGSAAVGTGVDQFMNPDKPLSQSASEGTLNAAIGEILPWLAFEKAGIKFPKNTRILESTVKQEPTVRTMIKKSIPNENLDHALVGSIQKEIERLKGLDTSKLNAGGLKQVENAIARNEAALGSLEEVGYDPGIISETKPGIKSSQSKESGPFPGWLGTLLETRKTRLTKGAPLDPLSKFLSSLGFNIGADTTINSR